MSETTTTTDTPQLTQELGEQIAAHLTPGPWANVQDEPYAGDYERGRRLTLRFVGEDPTLEGTMLTALASRADASGAEWIAHMWGPGHSGYLIDHLSYATRQTWRGSTIKISLTKPPAQIGRELSRRLLSHYLPAYREGMAGLQRKRVQADADSALAAELAAIAGGKSCRMNNQDNMPWRVTVGRSAHLTCQHGSVTIAAFSITPDQAREFVALVQAWEKTL